MPGRSTTPRAPLSPSQSSTRGIDSSRLTYRLGAGSTPVVLFNRVSHSMNRSSLGRTVGATRPVGVDGMLCEYYMYTRPLHDCGVATTTARAKDINSQARFDSSGFGKVAHRRNTHRTRHCNIFDLRLQQIRPVIDVQMKVFHYEAVGIVYAYGLWKLGSTIARYSMGSYADLIFRSQEAAKCPLKDPAR